MNPFPVAIGIGSLAALVAIWFGPAIREHFAAKRAQQRAEQDRLEMRRRADEEMNAARQRVERQREREERREAA